MSDSLTQNAFNKHLYYLVNEFLLQLQTPHPLTGKEDCFYTADDGISMSLLNKTMEQLKVETLITVLTPQDLITFDIPLPAIVHLNLGTAGELAFIHEINDDVITWRSYFRKELQTTHINLFSRFWDGVIMIME